MIFEKMRNKSVWCICKSTIEIINHYFNLDKKKNEGRRNLKYWEILEL